MRSMSDGDVNFAHLMLGIILGFTLCMCGVIFYYEVIA
jgi:hypothetical protein